MPTRSRWWFFWARTQRISWCVVLKEFVELLWIPESLEIQRKDLWYDKVHLILTVAIRKRYQKSVTSLRSGTVPSCGPWRYSAGNAWMCDVRFSVRCRQFAERRVRPCRLSFRGEGCLHRQLRYLSSFLCYWRAMYIYISFIKIVSYINIYIISLWPFFSGENFSSSNLGDLLCSVILPVLFEIVTLCKAQVNQEHLVAKLLRSGALELLWEAAAIKESTEARCLVSWVTALTPELFVRQDSLPTTVSSPLGMIWKRVAVVSMLSVEHVLSAMLRAGPVVWGFKQHVQWGMDCWYVLRRPKTAWGKLSFAVHTQTNSVFSTFYESLLLGGSMITSTWPCYVGFRHTTREQKWNLTMWATFRKVCIFS